MICKHFGECGSCSLYAQGYDEQLESKRKKLFKLLTPFYQNDITAFASDKNNFRARAEYKIYHDNGICYYAMRHMDKKRYVVLQECPMASKEIQSRMWKLLDEINKDEILKRKLFGVEFLSTAMNEVMVTMLYHRKLDNDWKQKAYKLAKELDIKIIGRSRGQKVILKDEYVTERLRVHDRDFFYHQYEQSFTQPNRHVNEKMISWAFDQAKKYGKGDFCELYAGSGNFTIPLCLCFDRAIATEISKRSIYAAHENCSINHVSNIEFVRMSSEEFTQALDKKRNFRRLDGIDLDSYNLGTVLVDPPRAGLDDGTRKLISTFDTIIYISCNVETLARDLEDLSKTHIVKNAALFDQFAYTQHMEAGVLLLKKL